MAGLGSSSACATSQASEAALTLAAALSVRSPFVAPFGMRSSADESKANWAVGGSDHLAVLRAYAAWEQIPRIRDRADFCQQHFLSSRSLESIAEIKRELGIKDRKAKA